MKRTMTFLVAVAVAAGFAVTSQARSIGGTHATRRADVHLTFTKWFSPAFPNMMGVVGGDIAGKFGGSGTAGHASRFQRPLPANHVRLYRRRD